jgi:hypothetical protein
MCHCSHIAQRAKQVVTPIAGMLEGPSDMWYVLNDALYQSVRVQNHDPYNPFKTVAYNKAIHYINQEVTVLILKSGHAVISLVETLAVLRSNDR